MMISMISLVGCNGLWDFDDDDDMTLAPTKFTVSGKVASSLITKNVRAAVASSALKVQAFNLKKNSDGTLDEVAIGEQTGLTASGTDLVYEHSFSSYTGSGYYFFLKVFDPTGGSNFQMRNVLGQLESQNDVPPDVPLNATSTAKAFLIKRSVINGSDISDFKNPEDFDPTTDSNWNNVLSVIENNLESSIDIFGEDIDPTSLTDDSNTSMAVPATTVTITNEASISNMVVGDKEPLTADIEPSYATVNWTSSDPSIASITRGVLTALAEGTTTVTVSDGQGTSDSVIVTVAAAEVNVEGVTLNKSTTSIAEGATETLTATVAPPTATNKSVTWRSSEPTVATVDSSGKITALKAGTTTITVTTEDGSFTDTCAVTVTEVATGVMSVTFDSAVSGQDTASIQIVIRNVDYTTYTNSVDITYTQSGTNKTATFAKDATLSTQFQEVTLAPEDGSLTSTPYAIPDFQTLTFSQEVPFGATVAVYDLNNNTDLVTYTVPNP
jgi:uncharacterized protein YjdB